MISSCVVRSGRLHRTPGVARKRRAGSARRRQWPARAATTRQCVERCVNRVERARDDAPASHARKRVVPCRTSRLTNRGSAPATEGARIVRWGRGRVALPRSAHYASGAGDVVSVCGWAGALPPPVTRLCSGR
ncbi:hypothetical protein EVAR_61799_1 [Eumeta japonica]|uniref:Uncharacterized protein n=1 Tax=Eumeta variegata TaxID=151549 RepID=A0A4C1Z3V0_EUMVA|nr:hypothetical protein EVAR_61799_1 [Eumeta japonica]